MRTTTAAIFQPKGETRSRPSSSTRRTLPSYLLAGIARWEDIDRVFARKSRAILNSSGPAGWLGCGGVRRQDGRLSFGSVSSIARAVLRELCDAPGGFLWTCDSGTEWAVVPSRTTRGETARSALALTWHGVAWLVDPLRRRCTARSIKASMDRLDLAGHEWSRDKRIVYSQLAHSLRRIQLADLATELLGRLPARKITIEGSGNRIDPATLANSENAQQPSVCDVADALREAVSLEIAELRFGASGWDPHIVRQASAINEVVRMSDGALQFKISPLWRDAVAAVAIRAQRGTWSNAKLQPSAPPDVNFVLQYG